MLQLSILRAEILSDGGDCEMAEIEAVIEEAAELVEESQPKHPTYYRSYPEPIFCISSLNKTIFYLY